MPSFVVRIRVAGPFRDVADRKVFDGAYSDRFVFAADARAAAARAAEDLRGEPCFARLKPIGGIGAPLTEVDAVRQVRWYEGLLSSSPLVFIRKRTGHD